MKKIKSVGTSFEYRVMHYFEDLGWWVFRSAGSHSVADLIAFKEGHVGILMEYPPKILWIQCKASGKPNLTFEEKKGLLYGQMKFNIQALIVCREPKAPWNFIWYVFEDKKLVQTELALWI